MTDRRPGPARRTSLVQTIVTVAAAAVTSAAVVWSALFYGATQRHARAVAAPPAPIVRTIPAAPASQPATSTVAPVTTRTS
jgi:negative regulator of sigma E activity